MAFQSDSSGGTQKKRKAKSALGGMGTGAAAGTAIMPGWGTAIGAGVGLLGGLLGSGSKADIPDYTPVDINREMANAVQSNIAQFGLSKDLIGDVNTFNQEQLDEQLSKTIPGYKSLVTDASNQIGQFLRGQVPTDVSEAVSRNSAQAAASGGFAGSSFARNLTARDFGQTSLDMINTGFDHFDRFTRNMRDVGMTENMGIQSQFMSPTDRVQLAIQENQFKWRAESGQATADAAPNPFMQSLGGAITQAGEGVFAYGMKQREDARADANLEMMLKSLRKGKRN